MAVLIEKEEKEQEVRCEDTKEEKEMSDPFPISQAKSFSFSPSILSNTFLSNYVKS